jgi:antitoxin FitA
MAQILVRGLDDDVVELLKDMARSNNRSLQGEAKTILEQAVDLERRRRDFLVRTAELRERWRREGRVFSDSAELIREDRDSR